MLEIDVTRRLGAFTLDARFRAGPGITSLFGRSGSGKTSLVSLLAGLARPDRGRIVIDERVLFDSEMHIDVPAERRQVGYVFQEPRLFPHMSVRGNLRYGMGRAGRNGDPAPEFAAVVELLGLGAMLHRRPATLSGGEKQRVAIGRALLSGPRVLLMDEPLASLDGDRKAEILPYIENLREATRVPIVYVSHAIEEVVRLADTMVVLSDGAVMASGPVEAVMARLDLRPYTGRYEAGAVLPVEVASQDGADGLTELRFGGGSLWVPAVDLAPGTRFRVRVRAHDVSLDLVRPERTSVLNVFAGIVKEIEPGQGAQADVLVDVGVLLVARLTRRAVSQLALHPGVSVFASVKAVVVDRRPGAPLPHAGA